MNLNWLRCLIIAPIVAAICAPGAARAQGVAEVQVTPETLTLAVGAKQTLFVAAFDKQGNLLPTAQVDFVSSDSSVARVGADGTVVGLSAGLAKIEARAQGHRAAVAVSVTQSGGAAPPRDPAPTPSGPPPTGASALTLDPPGLVLLAGESAPLSATALRSDGTPAGAVTPAWRSLRPAVATISADGVVTGVAPGEAVIQASARGGLAATAPVTVTAGDVALEPDTVVGPPLVLDTIRAVVRSQGGRELRGGLAWSVADTLVARVGPTGIVQTLALGETDVIATGLGMERRTHLVVYRRPEIFHLVPRTSAGPVQVPVGGAVKILARAEAADSTAIPEARPRWELADTTLAAFDPASGMLTGRRPGTTSLTARLAGFDPAVWVVQVLSGDLTAVPSRLGLAAGTRATVQVRFADSAAAPTPVAGVSWASDRPDLIAVDPDGVATGMMPGRAALHARTPWGGAASLDAFVTGDMLLSSNRMRPGFGIYQTWSGAGDSLLRVLVDTATNILAAWSPDRTRIAFSSNRAGTFDLYLMDADGRNVRALTQGAGVDGQPAWTPDGARIIFAATQGGAGEIHSIAADGSDERQLTSGAGGNRDPAVSPDGRTIAFASARDGNFELYLMDADGANVRRLTTTPVREAAPRFFPNGDLAYLVDRAGRSGGSSILRRTSADPATVALVESPATIVSYALARDGSRLAYVAGRIAADSRSPSEFTLYLQPAVPGATPARMPLGAAEQPVSPAF